MYMGNSAQSQKMMRARVAMQGLTVLAIAAGGAWTFGAGAGAKDAAGGAGSELGGIEAGYEGNLGKLAAAAANTGTAVRRNSGGAGGAGGRDAMDQELVLTYSASGGGGGKQ